MKNLSTLVIGIFLSTFCVNAQTFCDQAQDGPGFPSDPECEAAVCGTDSFCCTGIWDAVCASTAAEELACVDCSAYPTWSQVSGMLFVDYNCNGSMDVGDIAVSQSFEISSSLDGVFSNSLQNGTYSGMISPSSNHEIAPLVSAAFSVETPVIVNTPDSSNSFENVDFGLCPVQGITDLSVSFSNAQINPDINIETVPNGEFTFDVCITNLTAFNANTVTEMTYDNDDFTILEAENGLIEPGLVSWTMEALEPMATICVQVTASVESDAEVNQSSDIAINTQLEDGFAVDADQTNNSAIASVFIIDPTNDYTMFCDMAQGGPGFPFDGGCQEAICAFDPFCCSNTWDIVCAQSALTEPNCAGCLQNATASYLNGTVYLDLDCNGAFDGEDVLVPGASILGDGNLVGVTNQSGQYSGLIASQDSIDLFASPFGGYSLNTQMVYSDSVGMVLSDVNFAYCPMGDVVNLGVSLSPVGLPPRPGFPVEYQVCAYNYSTSEVEGQVTFDFSNMPDATVVSTDGGEVFGSEIIWEVGPMGLFEEICFNVVMQVIQGTPPGTIMNPVASIEPVPSTLFDIEHENDEHSFSHEVVAAYDPNDKTVDYPVVNFTEIEEGEGTQLEYLIRFQNTGNFFATIVRVEDQLPELLDINTIEMIHASHDYEIVIHPDNMVEWVFNDIMLPDSTTNEPESHGQIHFRIKTVADVSLEDVVENSASIFFDFKDPVVTEPAVTTFMDCSEGSLDVLGLEAVCAGEALTLNANRPDFESYTWTIDGQAFEGSEIEVTAPTASVNVVLSAIHHVCELSTAVTLDVIEVPEVTIEIEEDLLVTDPNGENYAWYLDGELLEWAMDSWIVPAENGNYEVIVTYDNGCTSSGELLFQSVGLADADWESIVLVPNPASEFTQLLLPTGNWQVSLMSVSGKTISSFENVTTSRLTLDLQDLSPGLYFINVRSEGQKVVRKLIIE